MTVPLAALFGALAIAAGPAGAHVALSGSDPADGARIEVLPARVSLTFNEEIQPSFAVLTVVAPDGAHLEQGGPAPEGRTLSTTIDAAGAAGRYTVAFRVISADGHPIQGTYNFELTRSATGAPSPEPSGAAAVPPAHDHTSGSGDSGGLPLWVIAAGLVIVLAGGGFAVVYLTGRYGRH
ncbi:copper resistance CopC family protein [Nocardia wallacei]|uniref:copper resistance CopC family protein n=1 Tax=Nocardia wallacei TaxID=480035 RepID=UPI0024564F53|nr:copper resistance protein CopC [Nocardia wallacei]